MFLVKAFYVDIQIRKIFKIHSNGGYVTSPKIGRYCGNRIQPIIKSDSNILMVKFRSDDSLSAPGFEIFWDGTTIGRITFHFCSG